MKKSLLSAGLVAVVAYVGAPIANAATAIPFPNAGVINPNTYVFTTAATGDIISYYYSSNAGDTDEIVMSVNDSPVGSFGLNNHTSSIGMPYSIGSVNAGDVITFVLRDLTTGTDISSNPAFNKDLAQGSNYDYNDDSFVFTKLSSNIAGATPLLAILPLFATGLGVIGLFAHRKKRHHRHYTYQSI
jgi:hypothetical protein